MTKIQSGLTLIGTGIVLNVVGRLVIPFTRSSPNVIVAGVMALWMIASLVLVLFGLFRLIAGLVSKTPPAPPG